VVYFSGLLSAIHSRRSETRKSEIRRASYIEPTQNRDQTVESDHVHKAILIRSRQKGMDCDSACYAIPGLNGHQTGELGHFHK